METALSLLMEFGPLVVQFGPKITQFWNGATSNATFFNKVENELPLVGDFANKLADAIWPSGAPAVHKIVATALSFNMDLVKYAQKACNTILHTNLDVDGYYGPLTHAAVTQLQTQLGLTADGWFGKVTEAAVKKLNLSGL